MDLNTLKNVNEILKLVAKDKGTSAEVKVDVDEATNFFGNIINDIDRELDKDEAKEDKKKDRLFVYPLRINVW